VQHPRLVAAITPAAWTHALQGQLRAQLLAQVQRTHQLAVRGCGSDQRPSLWARAMDGIILEYLDAEGLHCAASVFAAEAGIADVPALSRADVEQLLRVASQPRLAEALAPALQRHGVHRACCAVPCFAATIGCQ
jgi:hypothetical protein